MNAKLLIVALCAFQLAAGQTDISTILQPLQNQINNATTTAQQQVNNVTQQLQTAYNSTLQTFTSQAQNVSASIQKYAQSINATSQQAKDCLDKFNQQYTAIVNATQAQLSQNLTNGISQVNASSQNFQTTANSPASQITSTYSKCLGTGPLAVALNFVKCSAAASAQVASALLTIPATIANGFKSLASGLSAASAYIPGSDSISPVLTQLQQVSNQTQQCLQNSVASATPTAAPTVSVSANASVAGSV